MDGVTELRQLAGHFQELWDLCGFPLFDHPRCCMLDLNGNSMDDELCSLMMGERSNLLKMIEASPSPPSKKSRRDKSQDKALPLISCDMEQRLWKEFPEDLFEAVLARLPIDTFFRFRTVCRKWNSLITSNSFCKHISEVPKSQPWFYTLTHENISSGAMFDPSLGKWHHQTIHFIPERTIILPVASAGGLICFLDLGHKMFFVCNPLTDSFKELPPRSVRVWSRVAVGMTLNGKNSSSGYKIVWLGCNGDYEVYDSLLNKWIRSGNFPPSIKLPLSLNFRSQTVAIGSTLYFMLSEPDGILSYDVANGVWKHFSIPSPLSLSDHTLAEYGGKVMLVGLLSKNAVTCVCIWELQKMTLLWKEVDRMPNIWCLDFYGKHVRMTCLGNQGLLLLSLRSRRMNRLVTYDMSNKEWQKVPDCMLSRGRKRQWTAYGIAFYPCPTALA